MVYLLPKHSLGYYLHSTFKHLYTHIQVNNIRGAIPLPFYFPLLIPLCSLFYFLLLTWKPSLLWQDLVHLGLRLLVNWPPLSQPFPIPSPFQIPRAQGNCAPHYDDFKIPASPVRNRYISRICMELFSKSSRQPLGAFGTNCKNPGNVRTSREKRE